jgi:hypothetical protein
MAKITRVGDITVHRIVEQEYAFMPALEMLPELTPELLAENRSWMEPAALDKEGRLILCFQSYVLRTPHHVILVDTCVGNDKRRPTRPKWNMKTDDVYMTRLAAAGFSVEDTTSCCAPISIPTMSAGIRGSKTAAGCRPFPMRAMSSAPRNSPTGPR